MFTEEELEGCPNPQFEEFLQKQEAKIRLVAENMDAYNSKKCPYA